MSLRRYTVLLALAALLFTTMHSPAAVTVLPETTPTPRSKQEKPAKRTPHPDKSDMESTHPPEKIDPEFAKKIGGVWRGRISGKSGTGRTVHEDVEFTFTDGARSVTFRMLGGWVDGHGSLLPDLGPKFTEKTRVTAENTLTAFHGQNGWESYTFRLSSASALKVNIVEKSPLEMEGTLHR